MVRGHQFGPVYSLDTPVSKNPEEIILNATFTDTL